MNIAVVGAGLVGRLMAWQLLEQGHKVSLFDKDSGGGEQSAGIVAAAMLAPFSEILDAEPAVYEHGLKGFAVWQGWVKQLEAASGENIDLRLSGSVVLAHRNDMGDYQRFVSRLRGHNVVDQSAVQELDQQQLNTIEPELSSHFHQACFLEQEGCLDNHALFKALAARLNQLNVSWHIRSAIDDIGQACETQLAEFDKVLDCRGFSASKQIDGLRGVRGEVLSVYAPEVNLTRPVRLMHPRYKLYISPKPNHRYVIGATQIESSNESNITVRSSLELLSALYSVHSGFSEAEIVSQSARCRPAFADNLPRIATAGKVISINGLYRHGYLLSPQVVKQGLALLNNETAVWPEIVTRANSKPIEAVA